MSPLLHTNVKIFIILQIIKTLKLFVSLWFLFIQIQLWFQNLFFCLCGFFLILSFTASVSQSLDILKSMSVILSPSELLITLNFFVQVETSTLRKHFIQVILWWKKMSVLHSKVYELWFNFSLISQCGNTLCRCNNVALYYFTFWYLPSPLNINFIF